MFTQFIISELEIVKFLQLTFKFLNDNLFFHTMSPKEKHLYVLLVSSFLYFNFFNFSYHYKIYVKMMFTFHQ